MMAPTPIKTAIASICCLAGLLSCGAGKAGQGESADAGRTPSAAETATLFSADSAYANVAAQVAFGPRVPGSDAHRKCGDWLTAKLQGYGAEVAQQTSTLTTFDGTRIPMRNIFARINPGAEKRILLLAHWDCRPWADNDPDPANRNKPVDGANDGASGTGVLLEIARITAGLEGNTGIDILFCDAEDWGTAKNDESWAMGTRYFAANPPQKGYAPAAAILLDMVGAQGATFMREYYSQLANPSLADEIWATAHSLGYEGMFLNRMGSAINDDHIELIKGGIPAIDIIDYREGEGFFSGWHTASDDMRSISHETLEAVGRTIETYINKQLEKQ